MWKLWYFSGVYEKKRIIGCLIQWKRIEKKYRGYECLSIDMQTKYVQQQKMPVAFPTRKLVLNKFLIKEHFFKVIAAFPRQAKYSSVLRGKK